MSFKWIADDNAIRETSGDVGSINNRHYDKVNAGKAIIAFNDSGEWANPVFISDDAAATVNRADSGGPWADVIEVEYMGFMWQFNPGNHGMPRPRTITTSYPIITDTAAAEYGSACALVVLQQVHARPAYDVVFNSNGGTGSMPGLTAGVGDTFALPACTFEREEYIFSGWAIIPGGDVVYQDQESVSDIAAGNQTITLYAVWSAMPFSITLQYNKSEPIALDKDLETIATLHGVLREDSSIIDPVILIEGDLALFAQANYMTIQRFHRKYFIVDMVSVRSNFIEITAHCDVLSSFAGAIRSNKGIVHRQEKDWNLMLNDGALQVYQDPLIDTIAFPGSFSGQSYVMLIGGNRGGGIVMGSGDGNISGKTTSGLVAYAQSRLGTPYWYGCYGQTASAALYNTMATLYPLQYTASDFPDQYGQHVQDCVGLVKGYRWSSDPTAEPVYNASEDVNVAGMYSSCNERHTIASATPIIGSVLFNLTLTHCGVYVGNGKVIEARGHAYGVVQTDISDAGRTWTWWGIPSWLTVSTVAG